MDPTPIMQAQLAELDARIAQLTVTQDDQVRNLAGTNISLRLAVEDRARLAARLAAMPRAEEP